jgi:hypothetical protein
MKKFLCTFYLPEVMDADFWAVLPRHRMYINRLMRDEQIVTYSVNQYCTKGWLVLQVPGRSDAEQLIEQLPIRPFIDYHLEELYLFDTMLGAPKMVLN